MGEGAEKKKVMYSGIQPSGSQTIGNFIGSTRNWLALSDEFDCLFCAVDLHAITVRQDPAELRKNTRALIALFIAAGLDPVKNIIYAQSHVSAHAELAWILNCFTYIGELSRMTQFKEKSQKHESNINAGLLTYPALMAADILLYQADVVPVGADQKQHLEITRDVAERINGIYGNVFKVPEPYIPKVGAKIMGLLDPTKKMSKSSDAAGDTVFVLDPPDIVRAKLKRAVTDSDGEIRYDPDNKPGVSNLLTIYASLSDKTSEEAAVEFAGQGYGVLKSAVAERIIQTTAPIQAEFTKILEDKAYLDGILTDGAKRAEKIAARTLTKLRKKIGFLERGL
ncbi:tryptophan--tRNA ligase [Clostridia bacterium]|nr:tryptophan--tRNA ligase [Clostridia bacterium]